jgi:hypothetical protein
MQDRPQTPDPDQIPADARETGTPEPDPGPERVEITATPRRADAPTTPQKSRAGTTDRSKPFVGPPVPPVVTPSRPQSEPSRGRPWSWPLISLVGLIVVVLINWLANWVPFNDQTTGQVSRQNAVPFQPAGWAFLIWTLIYVLLFAFVIYSFLPSRRRSARIQAVGPLFLISNIANISWLFAWHWERFALSLIAIVVLLGSLAAIYGVLRGSDLPDGRGSSLQRFLVRGTFSIYLGWISIATLANLQVWMDNGGWNGGPFGLRGWTVIYLIGGILVAAAFAFLARDAAYPLVFTWGYLAIAFEQWGDSALISILAGVLAVTAAALTVMAALLAFDARRDPASPARSRLRRPTKTTMSSGSSDDSPLSTSR